VPGALDDIVRAVIVGSPYGRLLGLEVVAVEPERVRVKLPFRAEVTTVGDVVHGGAIGSLVDVAATAAAWSGADPATATRGATVALAINYLAPGRGQDLLATARVIQRGRTLCVCDVDVEGADGARVARALVTYRLS